MTPQDLGLYAALLQSGDVAYAGATDQQALYAQTGYELDLGYLSVGGLAYTLVAASGTYAVAGQSATLQRSRSLIGAVGSYALTGQNVALQRSRNLTGLAGRYAITGQSTGIQRSRSLASASGSYAVVGQPAILQRSRLVIALNGAYGVTGQPASLLKSRALVGSTGSYTITGQAATVLKGWKLAGSAGAYALAGQAATLRYTSVATAYTLSCAAGGYVVGSQSAVLSHVPSANRAGRGNNDADPWLRDYQDGKAAQIIAQVAIKQISNQRSASKRARQIQREISHADLQWHGFYKDLLAQARNQALTEQIRAEYARQRIDAQALKARIANSMVQQMQDNEAQAVIALMLLL